MAKQTIDEVAGFGHRLALRRQAAGYTQQQLADEIGVSRRMIAYYEGETGHPPASFLVQLARALNTSTDELLGVQPTTKPASSSISARWERRVRQIERLSAKPKQQLLSLIDTFIAAEQLRQSVNAGNSKDT